jgi:hypothetical protein
VISDERRRYLVECATMALKKMWLSLFQTTIETRLAKAAIKIDANGHR